MRYRKGNAIDSEAILVLWRSSFLCSWRRLFEFFKFHEKEAKHNKRNSNKGLTVISEVKIS